MEDQSRLVKHVFKCQHKINPPEKTNQLASQVGRAKCRNNGMLCTFVYPSLNSFSFKNDVF